MIMSPLVLKQGFQGALKTAFTPLAFTAEPGVVLPSQAYEL